MNKPVVLSINVKDYLLVGSAIQQAIEMFASNVKGKKVLVKPNMLASYKPDECVLTHPEVVKATVSTLISKGANVIVGDNPGPRGYGIAKKIAQSSGLETASLGKMKVIGNDNLWSNINAPWGEKVRISKAIVDSDLIVNLPKLKTHMLTKITCAVKNTFGYLVGAEKTRVHKLNPLAKDFSRAIVDIYKIRPPEVNIIDAIYSMEGDGPTSGKPRFIGKILASNNAVALDAAVCHIIGISPEKITHLKIANQEGLGPLDIGEIEIIGDISPVKKFTLPSNIKTEMINSAIFKFVLNPLIANSELYIETKKCMGCGLCIDSCPAEAITIQHNKASIDRHKCFKCYCCHEICSQHAIMESGIFGLAKRIIAKRRLTR